MLAVIAFEDIELLQMDVKTAFLERYLNEFIYREKPEGFVNPGKSNFVCKIQKALYELRHASRQSFDKIDFSLCKKLYWKSCAYDPADFKTM